MHSVLSVDQVCGVMYPPAVAEFPRASSPVIGPLDRAQRPRGVMGYLRRLRVWNPPL